MTLPANVHRHLSLSPPLKNPLLFPTALTYNLLYIILILHLLKRTNGKVIVITRHGLVGVFFCVN